MNFFTLTISVFIYATWVNFSTLGNDDTKASKRRVTFSSLIFPCKIFIEIVPYYYHLLLLSSIITSNVSEFVFKK